MFTSVYYNEHMRDRFVKKINTIVLLLLIFVNVKRNIIFADEVIYSPSINKTYATPSEIDDVMLFENAYIDKLGRVVFPDDLIKPTAPAKDTGSIEDIPRRKFADVTIQDRVYEKWNYVYSEEEPEFLAIRRTNSITNIYDNYYWEKVQNGNKEYWTLYFYDRDLGQNEYFRRTNDYRKASDGFYRVDGKVYYFYGEYMYVGKLKDEYDTIYEFGEDGAMIKKTE